MRKKLVTQELVYACRYILFFAKNGNKVINKKTLCEIENLPLNFISKISTKMKQAGIISSTYGICGGNNLAKPIEEITIYEIVSALNMDEQLVKYPKKEISSLEPIDLYFDSILEDIYTKMQNTTLADVYNLYFLENSEIKEKIRAEYIEFQEIRGLEINSQIEITRKETIKGIAKNLMNILNVEIISQVTGLSPKEIKKLKAQRWMGYCGEIE